MNLKVRVRYLFLSPTLFPPKKKELAASFKEMSHCSKFRFEFYSLVHDAIDITLDCYMQRRIFSETLNTTQGP